MTQLFFRKPLQSHRQYQWLHKKCGKPCGTVATTYYFSPLLLAKLATQNEAVTFSSIANIFNHLANRNLFTMCEKKKKESKDCPMVRELPMSSTIVLIFDLCRHHFLQLGPIHTYPEIFVSAIFFLRIHLASTRVRRIRSVYPEISVYALQSGNFCIRCVSGYVWTLVSVDFCIR